MSPTGMENPSGDYIHVNTAALSDTDGKEAEVEAEAEVTGFTEDEEVIMYSPEKPSSESVHENHIVLEGKGAEGEAKITGFTEDEEAIVCSPEKPGRDAAHEINIADGQEAEADGKGAEVDAVGFTEDEEATMRSPEKPSSDTSHDIHPEVKEAEAEAEATGFTEDELTEGYREGEDEHNSLEPSKLEMEEDTSKLSLGNMQAGFTEDSQMNEDDKLLLSRNANGDTRLSEEAQDGDCGAEKHPPATDRAEEKGCEEGIDDTVDTDVLKPAESSPQEPVDSIDQTDDNVNANCEQNCDTEMNPAEQESSSPPKNDEGAAIAIGDDVDNDNSAKGASLETEEVELKLA